MSDIGFYGIAAALCAVVLAALSVIIGFGVIIYGMVRAHIRNIRFAETGALPILAGLLVPLAIGLGAAVLCESGDLAQKERLDNTCPFWGGAALIGAVIVGFWVRRKLRRRTVDVIQTVLILLAISVSACDEDPGTECIHVCEKYEACASKNLDCVASCTADENLVGKRDFQFCSTCLDEEICPPIKACDDGCLVAIPNSGS